MYYFIYSVFVALAMLIGLPYFLIAGLFKHKFYEGVPKRLWLREEAANPEGQPALWIQAVSVGETLVAKIFSRRLRSELPGRKIFLTTVTGTGQDVAKGGQAGDFDGVYYFPFDFRFSVRGALESLKPRVFLMVELEIWPNVIRCCGERGIPCGLISGRISERSFRNFMRFGFFFRDVFSKIRFFCVQREEDAARFEALGVDPGKITVTGSIKYDLEPSPLDGAAFRASHGIDPGRPILIAGSTMRGEDETVLEAFRHMREMEKGLYLILAPRHPERFDEVAALLRASGILFVRETGIGGSQGGPGDVLLLDTMGQLSRLYSVADAAFVGGSLLPRYEGHNVLEPALYGKPVLFGPHMRSFRKESDELLARGAGFEVRTAEDICRNVLAILKDRSLYDAMSKGARSFVEENRGAAEKTIRIVKEFL
jgi:3-deoxy-D-manno-octulosonic-acid transferase